jgi:hypothetical protein
MRIQPVVLTTPEYRADWGAKLAASLDCSGAVNPPVIHCDDGGKGAARATQEAIAAALRPNCHVLLLEDDVVADETAIATIAEATFPDGVGAISFCDMREVPEYSPDGLYVRPALGSDGFGWWGNQALLIHHDTADLLVRADWFSDFVNDSKGVRSHTLLHDDNGRNCSDIRISLLIAHFGQNRDKYAVHVPSLFIHVGHESRCFPGRAMGERETRNWIANRRQVSKTAGGEFRRDELTAPRR